MEDLLHFLSLLKDHPFLLLLGGVVGLLVLRLESIAIKFKR